MNCLKHTLLGVFPFTLLLISKALDLCIYKLLTARDPPSLVGCRLVVTHYLLGMPNYALVYNGPGNGGLLAYADSDWASDPITRKFTSGYVVKLASAVFS